MIKLIYNLLAFVLLASVLGCASRIPPDGGPKDTIAPKIIATIPSQKSVNTRPAKIEFQFDEFIELKDGGSGILISPPMAMMPDIQLKGKSIVLKMRQSFDENTTYTISLGGVVKDITEANLLEPYSLVFTSGPLLDSLAVTGRVIDAFSSAPAKDVLVMLYLSEEDSLPKKQLPRYFSQTDAFGMFKIENVKAGNYSIFALKDANKNYMYDQPGEAIGFQKQMFRVDSNLVSVSEIRLSAEKPLKQRLIKSTYQLPSTLILKYILPVTDIVLNDISSDDILPFYKNPESTADSLILALPKSSNDSLKLYVKVDDNHVDTVLINTVRLTKKTPGKKVQTAVDTSFKFISNIDKGKLLPSALLELTSNYPSKLMYWDKVYWIVDKDTLPVDLEPKNNGRFNWKYVAIPPKSPGKSIKLLALKGAFEDLYGRSSDTLKLDFRQMDSDETGTIELLIKDSLAKPGIDLILELIDAKKKVIETKKVRNGDLVIYPELSPGTYTLRIIEDANGNGKWDPGKFSSRQQAESMLFYTEAINVRASWDLAIEWNVHAQIPTGGMKQKK